MTIVWAGIAFALSILFFGLAFQQFRRPGQPRWLASDLAAQAICVVIVTLFAFGCGLLVKVVLAREAGNLAGLAYGTVLAALALAGLAAVRLIMLGRRSGAAAASAEVIRLMPAPPPGSGSPVKPVRPHRPRRKAA